MLCKNDNKKTVSVMLTVDSSSNFLTQEVTDHTAKEIRDDIPNIKCSDIKDVLNRFDS